MARQNGITVEESLKMDCMKNSKVIAGEKGISNIISNVNVMADPDIMSWVGGGEFLLTTGYSLNKVSTEEQVKLIKEAKKQGLAGLGVKIKPYLESMPIEVVGLAEEIGFPIIEIDQEISLSDIMTPIVNEIFNKQSYLLKKIEKIYEQFMDAMLNRLDIVDITELTSENIKNPIMLKLEFPNKVIERFKDLDAKLIEDIKDNAEKFYQASDKNTERKIYESAEMINGKYVDRLIIPIIAKDSVYGHIIAWGVNSSLGGYEMSVLEIASTTIALEVLKAISVREVENRYKSEFIEDLISLDEKRKEKAVERLSFFNLKKDEYYMSISIKLKMKEEEDSIDMASVQQCVSKMYEQIERKLDSYKLKGIIGSKIEKIIILLSYGDEEGEREVSDFISRVEELALKYEDIDIKIGVGRVYSGIENFNNSYIDSVKAINTGKILDDSIVTEFNKLGIYKILCQDHLEDELTRFYETTLKVLDDYDKKKSTELVKTLESYFENNGNLKKMSDSLFTHYNTILYRVQRIKEITGMDLEDPSDRLNLEVSLKMKKILGR
jgi:PucR family transcriptional regulator, purine catabolism regulatory protein